jgi:hypothetical protein
MCFDNSILRSLCLEVIGRSLEGIVRVLSYVLRLEFGLTVRCVVSGAFWGGWRRE